MSSDRLAEHTEEPASSSSLASVTRTVAGAARRLPVTTVIVAVLLITGVVFETLWRGAHHAPWFADFAYGVPALEDGRWWTVLTGPWVGLTPLQHLSLLLLVRWASAWANGDWGRCARHWWRSGASSSGRWERSPWSCAGRRGLGVGLRAGRDPGRRLLDRRDRGPVGTLGTGLLWAAEAVLLVVGRHAFGVRAR